MYKVAVSLARAATSPLECFSSMALAIVTETNKPQQGLQLEIFLTTWQQDWEAKGNPRHETRTNVTIRLPMMLLVPRWTSSGLIHAACSEPVVLSLQDPHAFATDLSNVKHEEACLNRTARIVSVSVGLLHYVMI